MALFGGASAGIRIDADSTGYRRELKRMQKDTAGAFADVRKQTAGMGEAFRGFGRHAAKAGAAVSAGLAIAAVKTIGLASDAAETSSKLQVTFGKSLPQVTAHLEAFADATGASVYTLRDQAANVGALLKPMNLGAKATADMSEKTVKLATDLSSFNNVPVDDALLALRSGLTGETEPLKQFGILMNEASINAEGLRLGLVKNVKDGPKIIAAQLALEAAQRKATIATREHGKGSIEARKATNAVALAQKALAKASEGSTGKLTEQQKVQARYSLIMRQTKDAQGDATRTANGYANASRGVSNAVKDAATRFGASLLPAVTKAANGLRGFLRGQRFTEFMDKASAALARFVDKISAWAASPEGRRAFDNLASGVSAAAHVVADIAGKIGNLTGLLSRHKDVVMALVGGYAAARVAYKTFQVAQAVGNAITVASSAVMKAYRAQLWASAAAGNKLTAGTKAMALAQGALNVVMTANPIGIAIAAAAALAVGLFILYKRSERFRSIVKTIGGYLLTAFKVTPVGLLVTAIIGLIRWIKDTKAQVGSWRDVFTAAMLTMKLKFLEAAAAMTAAGAHIPGPMGAAFGRANRAIRRELAATQRKLDSLTTTKARREAEALRTSYAKFASTTTSAINVTRGNLSGLQGALAGTPRASTKNGFGDGLMVGSARPTSVDGFTPLAHRYGLTMTSGYRPGDPGWHGKNRARDYSNGFGATPEQMRFAKMMFTTFGSQLKELIYTPMGTGIKNGKPVNIRGFYGDKVAAAHYNHVHVALERGGMIPGGAHLVGDRVPALLEPGEGVLNRNATNALGGRHFVDWANKSFARHQTGGVAGAVRAAVSAATARADRPGWFVQRELAGVLRQLRASARLTTRGGFGGIRRRDERNALAMAKAKRREDKLELYLKRKLTTAERRQVTAQLARTRSEIKARLATDKRFDSERELLGRQGELADSVVTLRRELADKGIGRGGRPVLTPEAMAAFVSSLDSTLAALRDAFENERGNVQAPITLVNHFAQPVQPNNYLETMRYKLAQLGATTGALG